MDPQTNLLKSGFLLVLFCTALSPIPTARAYEPFAHRLIVGKAGELYGQFGSSNEPLDYGLIIADGAEHEDDYDHVFGYHTGYCGVVGDIYTTITHFWDGDKGPLGLVSLPSVACDNENAFQKVTGYGTDEIGLWQQAVWHYNIGDKYHAYELLGHVSHLIADMSVPAHVHEHEHVVACAAEGGDLYECLVSDNMSWLLEALDSEQLVDGLIQIPPGENSVQCDFCDPNKKPLLPLYYLMYTTNQRADFFASVYDWCAGPGWCPDETWGDLFDIHNYIWVNYLEYPFQMAYYQDPDHIKTDIWGCNNCGELLCIGGSQCAPCIYCGSYNVDHVEPSYAIAARCTLVHAVRATATLWEVFVNTVNDTTPPTTTLQMSDPKYYDGDDWHIANYTQLTLEATDNKSGVNCTFYCISDSNCDSNSTVYTGPFGLFEHDLDVGQFNIRYKSTDRAGNMENENEDKFFLGCIYNSTRQLYYTSIQAAIDDANDGDELLAGPTSYNEAIDFKGKAISLRSSHGPENTIINGSGIANAYHVVKCVSGEDANTILDGFTISGGDANGPNYPDRDGGGMYNVNSSPTVTNCIFIGNKANHGGGMLNVDCTPTVTGCTFENNVASGGTIGGGGMYNHNSSPLVTDCSFIGNSGETWGGGGMFNAVGSNPTVINCTFSYNNANVAGGGIYNWDDTTPILINCTFIGNSATEYGGGMFNINNSTPTVTGCSFNANTSQFGGGIYSESSSPAITNCVFRNNNATNSGGGMFDSNSSPTIINCTFSNNTAASNGGGIGNLDGDSSPTVTNCILWDDTPDEIYGGSPTVTYSDVQGGWPGTGNIDSSPLFENFDCGHLQLAFFSPCVDAGNNDAVPPDTTDLDGDGNTTELIPFDLAGNPRFVDDAGVPDTGAGTTPIVDMGAYELQDNSRAAKTIYVGDIPYFPDYNTIQEAINESHSGDQIVVLLGLYNEAIDFLGKAITVRSADPSDPIVVAQTIIDATGLGAVSVVTCRTCEGNDTILSGFTIRCGRGTYSGTQTYGGGMYNEGTSPTITNCIFTSNTADHGGGMFNIYGTPTVTNCTFIGNSASSKGSGMFNYSSSPTVFDCTFRNNFTWGTGGGMHNEGSSPTVINCIFNNNWAYEEGAGMLNLGSEPRVTNCTFTFNAAVKGGGMHNVQSSPTVINCIFNDNSAAVNGAGMFFVMSGMPEEQPTVINCTFLHNVAVRGGGLFTTESLLNVTNCTFTENEAFESGGAIYNEIGNILVTNSILWGDLAPAHMEEAEIGGNIMDVNLSYCDVAGPFYGPGIIYEDPCFVDVDGENLRLLPGSPCIESGDNTAVPSSVTTDLDGQPRIVDGDCNDIVIVDMGAYEFAWAYIGDFDGQCDVDFVDFSIFALAWLTEDGQPGWNPDCDISIPADSYINWDDLDVFADNWLAGTEP
ncbi:MAG: right-handed parallel beta-helix repeat-containing protein [Planctomycetota bacterium]|jgi:predicted outer membrane repeat protein